MQALKGCDQSLSRCLRSRTRILFHRILSMSATDSVQATNIKSKSTKKILVITGPTAVGKTAISLALAEKLNGEIISADSVQVYKGLDIGSDKISASDRRGIPHHLLDILEPEEEFSAGHFFHLARAAAEDIFSRGRIPIVVGGTGFYLRWFILGRPSTPVASKETEAAAQAALKQAWERAGAETDEAKWAVGLQLVSDLGDTESAQRLSLQANNYYRLLRVIDILLQSPGRTLADLDRKTDEDGLLDYDFRCFFLNRPRIDLYRRIDGRVEDMVINGLIPETYNQLVKRDLQSNENCATRAIGYRQTLDFLSSAVQSNTSIDESDIIQLTKNIQSASRKLCHRQLTWFRDDDLFEWIDTSTTPSSTSAMNEILASWDRPEPRRGVGNNNFNGGRLSKEEERMMKQYITVFEKLKPGTKEMQMAVEQARSVVQAMRTVSSLT